MDYAPDEHSVLKVQHLLERTIPAFREAFRETTLYKDMVATVEGSHWHREANVGVHTDMVVDHFLENYAQPYIDDTLGYDTLKLKRTHKEIVTGFLVGLFHDTGKPAARHEKTDSEGNTRFRFTGHEIISARLWEDYVVDNWDFMRMNFGLDHFDIYRITWMIENHLPYGLKNPRKVSAFAKTLYHMFEDMGTEDLFYDCIVSDGMGRISDNHAEKSADMQEWVSEYKRHVSKVHQEMEDTPQPDPDTQSKLYVMIGASGVGKSTFSKTLDGNVMHYSWDDLRVKRAMIDGIDLPSDNAYHVAWEYCNEPGVKFGEYQQGVFMELLATHQSIVIDNTNTSRKRRRFYIDEARKKGYHIIGVVFPVSKRVLTERQATRADKFVPLDASMRHFEMTSMPNLGGEVDEVIVVGHNL